MAKKTKPAAKKAAKELENKKNNKKVIIIVSALVGVLIVIPAIVFGTLMFFISNQLANSPVKDLNISSENGGYSVKDKEGNSYSTGASQKLSKDFPVRQISIYKGKTISVSRVSVDGKTSWTVTRQTSDSSEKVSSNTQSMLKRMGWTIDSEYSTASGSGISASKKDYSAVIIYTTSDDGITNISYTISQK